MLTRVKVLGRGGFGVVDQVIDDEGRSFARKTFKISDPDMPAGIQENVRRRFKKEVKFQQHLQHKNIVEIVSSHLDTEPPYYLMPLAQSSLDDDIAADKSLGNNYLKAIMDILAGLEEMHDLDMVHRDLKPKNILRYQDSEGDYYAIGDFGFVSANESQVSTLTSTDMKLGGDTYFAPELADSLRSGTVASDIYSVGCIIHSMVGSHPRTFMGEIHEDGPFGHIMQVCTRIDPARRFQSIASLREAILSVSEVDRLSVAISRNDLLSALASDDELDAATWARIEGSLVSDLDNVHTLSLDSRSMLQLLTQKRIDEVYAIDKKIFNSIGTIYASWARDYSFNFDFCDTLASRLEHFIELGTLSLKAECVMALLYLGASHNRFYVERVFKRNADTSIDDKLARKLEIEFHSDGRRACDAIKHLEHSIYLNRAALHPRIVAALKSMCK